MEMLTEGQLDSLSEFIIDNNGIFASTVPDALESRGDLYETVDTSDKCHHCGEGIIDSVVLDGEELAVCEGDCDPFPYQESGRYKLDIPAVFAAFCDALRHHVTKEDIDIEPMPLYAQANLDGPLRVNLICNTDKLQEAVEKLFGDAVRNSRVNAIFAPRAVLEEIHELAAEYPVANFTPAFSIPMLAEPDAITEIIENAVSQRERSNDAIARSDIKDEDLAETIENNPGAIRTELAYARVRREASLSPNTLGNYFESVCHAALMNLDIATKALGDSGENIADLAFKFPRNSGRMHGEEILGIVDTKSNGEKNLSEEKIADKHREYIWQATADRFKDAHVAHVFVVFDMAGLDANEVDWYRLIREEYRDAGVDGTMVVLYASALSQMVHIAQSALQTNELNLSTDGIHEVFRPFFHSGEFHHAIDEEVRRITRVEPSSADKETYIERYRECENLIVVLPEMVERRYDNLINSDMAGDDEAALDRYPNHDY
ncbi:hypothetical protein [Halobacterium zhouii]|uniref:hypothetical protein n=1 Tax=Halobacterium zhouii TaxID=2902624 RepID=UPI001E4F94A0|nr:hypothetical protein [Halobacterium zhouii]